MPSVEIPEETFRRLAERAATRNLSVDDYVRPALDRLAEEEPLDPVLSTPLTGDAWLAAWDAWTRDIENRSGRYPPGFVLDDSRDAIYRDWDDPPR